jgi:hypothetical protein
VRSSYAAVPAFIVASLVPAVVFALVNPLTDKGSVKSLLGWVLVFYLYSLLATVFLGLPVFLVLRRLGLIRWWSALASGAAIGALVTVLVNPAAAVSRDVFLAIGAGALAALGFWAVWALRKGGKATAAR